MDINASVYSAIKRRKNAHLELHAELALALRRAAQLARIPFSATSTTAVNSSSRTSLSMIASRHVFGPPIAAPGECTVSMIT
jgi:hypothetical protein